MVHALYGQIKDDELDESFYAILPYLNGSIIEAKQRSVLSSWVYMSGKANVNGIEFGQGTKPVPGLPQMRQPTPGFDVNPWLRNAPNAASGTRISELNSRAPAGVKALIGKGSTPKQALRVSEGRMIALTRTEVPLMARSVVGSMVESRTVPGFVRYRRVPAPGACPYCLAQASRGAVFRSAELAQGSHLPGGGYHANCRCMVQAETDADSVNETAIHPDDMRDIKTKFDTNGREWSRELGSEWYRYRNQPQSRPPDIEFLPLKAAA